MLHRFLLNTSRNEKVIAMSKQFFKGAKLPLPKAALGMVICMGIMLLKVSKLSMSHTSSLDRARTMQTSDRILF